MTDSLPRALFKPRCSDGKEDPCKHCCRCLFLFKAPALPGARFQAADAREQSEKVSLYLPGRESGMGLCCKKSLHRNRVGLAPASGFLSRAAVERLAAKTARNVSIDLGEH